MATSSETRMVTTILDNSGGAETIVSDTTFTLGTGNSQVEQEVSCTNGSFTAFVVPTGAKAVRIRTGGAASLVLKGVTGDTGIAISPSSGTLQDDMYLTLGASPSMGILNNGASPVTVRLTFE